MQYDNARILVDSLVSHELGRHFSEFANDYLDALMGLKGSRVHKGLLRPEPCRRTVPDSGVDYSLSLGRVFSLDWKPEVPSYTDLAYHLFLSVAGIYSSEHMVRMLKKDPEIQGIMEKSHSTLFLIAQFTSLDYDGQKELKTRRPVVVIPNISQSVNQSDIAALLEWERTHTIKDFV